MMREQIESELRAYRENAARLAALRARAVDIERELIEMRGDPSGVGATNLDGMPHAHNNTSIVEAQVMRSGKQAARLQRELHDVQTEAHRLARRVSAVETWLSALNERKRMLVELFYFEGLFWSTIRRRYEDEYKITLSPRHAKRIRDDALRKMERVSGG